MPAAIEAISKDLLFELAKGQSKSYIFLLGAVFVGLKELTQAFGVHFFFGVSEAAGLALPLHVGGNLSILFGQVVYYSQHNIEAA